MIRFNLNYYISIGILCVLSGCDDVFEEDISSDTIELISPINGVQIDNNYVGFWWKTLEGSSKYRIQIFDESNNMLKDTLTTQNRFEFYFDPGFYLWHVRGENFAYVSSFSEARMFGIGSNEDLTLQKVFLVSPGDNIVSSSNEFNLSWTPLNFADTYTLELEKMVSGTSVIELVEENIVSTSFSLSETYLEQDGIYTWKVKALNENSQTQYSKRKIFIDNEEPGIPVIKVPDDNLTTTKSITIEFKWDVPEDTGEVKSDIDGILEIATDTQFNEIIKIIDAEETNASFIFEEIGDFYWRVKLIDEAGNFSTYSSVRKINVR